MNATFTYAAIYQVTAVCQTPLRTGGADGDTEAVLRDSHGRAFLQGTSIAGALKEWLKSAVSPDLAEGLLGSSQITGRLVISDALFDPDVTQYVRPRVRIDHALGSAEDRGKFDVAHIGVGAKLYFSLVWLGAKEEKDELETVKRMLSALNNGAIRLGAHKSNGFGKISLTAIERLFDMTDEGDRQAWLNWHTCLDDTEGIEPLTLPDEGAGHRVNFTVTGWMDSMLVRAAATEQEGNEKEGSYTPNLTEGGLSVLPGSSIKGAVRARAEAVAEAVRLDHEWVQNLFGRAAEGGDNGKPGQVWFDDVRLNDSNKQKITRIRINKFTGGVMRGSLFKEEPVSGRVELHIAAPDNPIACALLLYTLRDLGLGLYNLGSGGSIGRGFLRVDLIKMSAPDGRRAQLRFNDFSTSKLEDEEGLVEKWLAEWGGAIREN